MQNLFYRKVFHVRSVTQGDVIRAEVKDIPRIFQVRMLNHKCFSDFVIFNCLHDAVLYGLCMKLIKTNSSDH